ncbi:hypothetical protein SCAR479_13593 [Seiridium cardinale]|uniref:F-box domain-containing protein n=1 Tax=Seiridium cardinale TaxID=138064 RepID=A0ABR2X7G5_9PEZI
MCADTEAWAESLSSSADSPPDDPFFFRLPAELRILILELSLDRPQGGVPLERPGLPSYKNAVSIFLVSKRMYADAVPIFYRDVGIDLRGFGSQSPPQKCTQQFLRTALVPRQHIRNVTLCLNMIDCCNCQSVSALELEKYVTLRQLTLLIGPDYPYPPTVVSERKPVPGTAPISAEA